MFHFAASRALLLALSLCYRCSCPRRCEDLGYQTRALTGTQAKVRRVADGHALLSRSYPARCQDPDLATLAAHQPTMIKPKLHL